MSIQWQMRDPILLFWLPMASHSREPRAPRIALCPGRAAMSQAAWGCRGMLEVVLAISITLHPRETLDSDSSAAGGGWMQRELQRSIV